MTSDGTTIWRYIYLSVCCLKITLQNYVNFFTKKLDGLYTFVNWTWIFHLFICFFLIFIKTIHLIFSETLKLLLWNIIFVSGKLLMFFSYFFIYIFCMIDIIIRWLFVIQRSSIEKYLWTDCKAKKPASISSFLFWQQI